MAYYRGLSEDQVHELLEIIRKPNGNIQLVYILDAYNELCQKYQGKNLYLSNNIDKFAPPKIVNCYDDKVLDLQPKVIISYRSEGLNNYSSDYKKYFVPIILGNENRGTSDSASQFFEEFPFIGFDD